MLRCTPSIVPGRGESPYLGFGWIGWIGLGILGALSLLPLLGVDPIYQFYHWLVFDQEVSAGIFRSAHRAMWAFSAIYVPWMDFRPPTMAIMIAIVAWSPLLPTRKRGLIAELILLSAASVAIHVAETYWNSMLPIGEIRLGPFRIWVEYASVHALVVLGVAASLLNATRSAWLARSVLSLGILGFTNQLGPVIYNHPLWSWVEFKWYRWDLGPRLIWNAALIATMLTWAIREHSRPPHCPKCGYDIEGLRIQVCPECGEDLSRGLRTRSHVRSSTRPTS